jgi:hypothetical protein
MAGARRERRGKQRSPVDASTFSLRALHGRVLSLDTAQFTVTIR